LSRTAAAQSLIAPFPGVGLAQVEQLLDVGRDLLAPDLGQSLGGPVPLAQLAQRGVAPVLGRDLLRPGSPRMARAPLSLRRWNIKTLSFVSLWSCDLRHEVPGVTGPAPRPPSPGTRSFLPRFCRTSRAGSRCGSRQRGDRGGDDPAAQPSGGRSCRTLAPHGPGGGGDRANFSAGRRHLHAVVDQYALP
jgi:hypothetical protein